MDKFFRSFLNMKWKIKGQEITFLDGLLVLAMTGSGVVMRLVLMGSAPIWYGLLDYAAAVLAGALVFHGTKSTTRAIGAYAVFLIVPTVLVVSSYWQKPEMCYVVLLLAALICIAGNKNLVGAACFGLAVLMNVQAVFVLPVLVVLWFYKRMDTRCLGIAAVFTVIRGVLGVDGQQVLFGNGNSAAAGRVLDGISNGIRAWELSGGDAAAVEAAKGISGGSGQLPLSDHWPNVYPFFGVWDFLEEYATGGLIFTAAVVLAVLVWFFLQSNTYVKSREAAAEFPAELLVELSLFFALLLPFFLPHMNARSGLLADILAVLLAFYNGRKAYIALVELVLSFSMYQMCLTGIERYPLAVYSLVMLVLLFAVGVQVWKDVMALTPPDGARCATDGLEEDKTTEAERVSAEQN